MPVPSVEFNNKKLKSNINDNFLQQKSKKNYLLSLLVDYVC